MLRKKPAQPSQIACSRAAGSSCAALLHAGCTRWQQHSTVRVLTHIKRLDDVFGDFLVRVVCECDAVREIEPEALARLVGWKVTLKAP